MKEYAPEGWIILRIKEKSETYYRVFGTWRGGYLDGDVSRLSSGAKFGVLEDRSDRLVWPHASGSVYTLTKHGEDGYTSYTGGVLISITSEIKKSGGSADRVRVLNKDGSLLNEREFEIVE